MGWFMRKKKKRDFPLDKGDEWFSLFQVVTSVLIISLLSCLGTTPTSLDVAMVSPFHPVAVPSRSTWCWDIQNPRLNYKLILYRTLTNFQKEINPYRSPKYQMRTIPTWKRFNVFWHLNWRIHHFNVFRKNSLIHGMLLNPVNKGKYYRNLFVCYLSCLFSLYNSFWDFLGQGLTPIN